MEKKLPLTLKEKLRNAIHKVLRENKFEFNDKIEKSVRKSVKRIVKTTDRQMAVAKETAAI